MKCYIKEIAIFDKQGSKREVKLKEGLNIITGESQTGKSALLEIVDYCLLSSRCTIPRGKITDFADMFAVVLVLENEYVVIGRSNPKKRDSNKAYFKVEFSDCMISDLQKFYFDKINPIPINSLKRELGRIFGFDIPDITLNNEFSETKKGRASFRNMTPYLFQHQNLIANKHAILYRFDDHDRRDRIVSEFPVFMGWVDGQYYSLNRELIEKKRDFGRLERKEADIEKNRNILKERLEKYIKSYYHIVGVELPSIENVNELVMLAQNLPDFSDKSFITTDFERRLVELKQERQEIFEKKSKVQREIQLLDIASNNAEKYKCELIKLSGRNKDNISKDQVICPLCSQELELFNSKVDSVINSINILSADLQKIQNYAIDNSATIEKLKKERDDLNQNIINVNGEIEVLNRTFENEKKQYDLKQKALEIKNLIVLSLDLTIGKSNLLYSNDEKLRLKDEISILEARLSKYNLKKYMAQFNINLSKKMNYICSKLDFEEELRPPNLKFNSENFDFYHELNFSEKVLLSEMGSGANWLACHISLLLGLHRQFSINKNCSVPSFIFFDQPSQVYFPKEFDPKTDRDVKSVENIYNVIVETLEEVEQEAGFKPQVIITDHAYNLTLKNNNFDTYVRKKWFGGEKLI